MKNWRWVSTALLLVSLVFFAAACGGGEEAPPQEPAEAAQAATNTPIPEPTDTPTPLPPTDTPLPPTDTPVPPTDTPPPEPTEAPAQAGGDRGQESLDLPVLEEPTDLDSFQSSMTITWRGTDAEGAEVSDSMTIDVEFVHEPPAQHVTISGSFPGMEELGLEGDDALEMYVVEGMMYMNLFGSWIQTPAEEGALDADEMAFVATEEMLDGLAEATYEGKKEYNGIETDHYSFDQDSFSPEEMPEGMEIEEANGNIYIATDGGYVVHMDVTMSGANMELPTGEEGAILQDGSMEVIVDLMNINEPIEIVVPEEALAAGEPPEDIPVPDNAEQLQVVDFMGMITFLSPSTPQEVADFYKAEMPNSGWTEISADEMAGMFSLEYSKGDRTASLLISADQETGKTSVLITLEGGG